MHTDEDGGGDSVYVFLGWEAEVLGRDERWAELRCGSVEGDFVFFCCSLCLCTCFSCVYQRARADVIMFQLHMVEGLVHSHFQVHSQRFLAL